MKITALSLVFASLITGSMAFAAESAVSPAQIGPAGCGLGNQAFGPHDSQIFAATLNGTGMQTFGITTGTSNCGPGAMSSQMDIFVDANKVALANDSARGQGETIVALANMLGCSDSERVGSTLKANYAPIFSAHHGDSLAISKEIQTTLSKSNACSSRNS